MKKVEVVDTGRVSYMTSYNMQLEYHRELRENPELPGRLIITEPNPTITKGIRGEESEIFIPPSEREARGIEVVEVRRGGRVTFHGPGQVVIYPLLNLSHFKKSIKWYIESLERVVVDTLREIGVEAHKRDDIIGIFSGSGKICAIGIEVKRWRTLHGIAINHRVDLDYFKGINPCGIGELGVSSIATEGVDVSRERLVETFKEKFSKVFEVEVV